RELAPEVFLEEDQGLGRAAPHQLETGSYGEWAGKREEQTSKSRELADRLGQRAGLLRSIERKAEQRAIIEEFFDRSACRLDAEQQGKERDGRRGIDGAHRRLHLGRQPGGNERLREVVDDRHTRIPLFAGVELCGRGLRCPETNAS